MQLPRTAAVQLTTTSQPLNRRVYTAPPGSTLAGPSGVPAPDPVLAVLAIVCWATLLYGLTNNHKVHRQALTLQSANSGLVNELKDLNSSLERKVAKRTRDLEYAAMRDPLTDLPNRRGFRTVMNYVLKSAEKSGQPFTIGVMWNDL